MTKEEILKMEAGPEVDALFAEKVMRWKKQLICRYGGSGNAWVSSPHRFEYWIDTFHPSTNISHAMQGVERFTDHDHIMMLRWTPTLTTRYPGCWSFTIRENTTSTDNLPPIHLREIFAETAPLAITRTLILWAMEELK